MSTAKARPGFIPFYRPRIGRRDLEQVRDALTSGWLTTGPKVTELEEGIRTRVGARHAIALNSCTAALHLALAASGVGKGDDVVTTPYTFAATGETILYLGARPVFADVDPRTLNIDPGAIERAMTRRTRAIVPVHIAGLPCAMDEIRSLARRRRIPVVEDAAHAIGASYRGRAIGAVGDHTCFSFYATKNLTTGEGGMVTTDDAVAARRIRRMSLHGLSRDAWKRYARGGSWRYDVEELGYKYNMTDLAAGIGLAQLERFDAMQDDRRRLARRYTRLLGGNEAFVCPVEDPRSVHAWHLYILRLNTRAWRIGRDKVIEGLRTRGIGTSVHFLPLHLHSFYRRTFGYTRGAYPVTERESARAISLPLFPGLTTREQDRVVAALLELASRHWR